MYATSDLAPLLAAVASIITAIAVLITATRTGRKLDEVHSEVKTSNGITIAALSDFQEGRRIKADIPEGDRTTSEQHYVDKLDAKDPDK